MSKTVGQALRERAANSGLVAIIGDEDTVTGFMLAGVGHVDSRQRKNFLVTSPRTTQQEIEEAFVEFTTRTDVSILLITQPAANDIRHLLNEYDSILPAIVEIPSKDSQYEPDSDSMMVRIRKMFGGGSGAT